MEKKWEKGKRETKSKRKFGMEGDWEKAENWTSKGCWKIFGMGKGFEEEKLGKNRWNFDD